MRPNVYKDFLTNSAVAWFSAGVITPFLFPSTSNDHLFTITISGIMTLAFISIAKFLELKKI